MKLRLLYIIWNKGINYWVHRSNVIPSHNGQWCQVHHKLRTTWTIFWRLCLTPKNKEFREFKNSFEGFPHDFKTQIIYQSIPLNSKMDLGKFQNRPPIVSMKTRSLQKGLATPTKYFYILWYLMCWARIWKNFLIISYSGRAMNFQIVICLKKSIYGLF